MDKQRVHTNPQHYSWLTEQLSPPSPLGAGLGRAFWVGGLICVLGQAIADAGVHWLDMNARAASSLTSITLVFLTALLTSWANTRALGPSCPSRVLPTPWYRPRWNSAARGWCWGWAQSCFPSRGRCWYTASAHPFWWAWSTLCFSIKATRGGNCHAAQAHRPANH